MAASRLSKKTHFPVPEQSPTIQQIPSKSHSNCLCKSLVSVLIILVIPLFPSQAPDFITESVLTQLWEIFHLLFIGIAVSYGLFSRKTAPTANERHVHSTTDASHEYLSGISNLSSIFEGGFGNLNGSGEQDVLQSYGNFQNLQSSNDQFVGNVKSVADKGRKIGSFVTKDRTEGVSESDGKRVNQVRRSEWLKGESFVMVSNGNEFLDKSNAIKPLNLPVRSLRSRIVDNDRPEIRDNCEPSPKFETKGNDVEVVKILGAVPKTLEKKGVTGPSTIPWRSRSARMEKGGDRNNPKHPAYSRPQSVGEFESEHLKSKSFRGLRNSGSPSKVENLEIKKDGMQPVTLASHPKTGPLDSEASFNGAKPHARKFGASTETKALDAEASFNGEKPPACSFGASTEMNAVDAEASSIGPKPRPCSFGASTEMKAQTNSEFNLRKSGDCEEVDGIGKGKQAIETLESELRSPTLAKVLSKAKSVRTIKPSRYVRDEKGRGSSEIDGREGRKFNKFEADPLVKRLDGEEHEDPLVNYKNQEFDHIFPMPKPKPIVPEMHNEEKECIDNRIVKKSEEDTGSESDKSSDEDDAGHNFDNDAELEGSEVDRKAGEFIAKFREQIRLQKISSVKGHSVW